MFRFEPEFTITQPSPSEEPTNSPDHGTDHGQRDRDLQADEDLRKRRRKAHLDERLRLLAQSDRVSSTNSAGVVASPLAVEMTIGKTQSRNETTILCP